MSESNEGAQAQEQSATEPKTFTQDEVNAMLARQKREQFGDYGDLKRKAAQLDELTEQSKTEAQRLAERAEAAERRAAEIETRAMRLEIAAEKGLTPAQAKRLVGATREELEADADELRETFGPATDDTTERVATSLDLGTRGTTTTASGDPAADFAKFLSSQLSG